MVVFLLPLFNVSVIKNSQCCGNLSFFEDLGGCLVEQGIYLGDGFCTKMKEGKGKKNMDLQLMLQTMEKHNR